MFTTVYVTIITLYSNNEYLLKVHDLQFAANICCLPWHTQHKHTIWITVNQSM